MGRLAVAGCRASTNFVRLSVLKAMATEGNSSYHCSDGLIRNFLTSTTTTFTDHRSHAEINLRKVSTPERRFRSCQAKTQALHHCPSLHIGHMLGLNPPMQRAGSLPPKLNLNTSKSSFIASSRRRIEGFAMIAWRVSRVYAKAVQRLSIYRLPMLKGRAWH